MVAPVCPICGDGHHAPFTMYDGIELFRCAGCGSVYMFPLPQQDVSETLYTDAYDGATTGYFSKVDKKMRRSRGRIRGLARHVSGGRFLDIGCSGGFMVEAARERGFEAWGLDIDPVSVRYAETHYPANRYVLGPVEKFAGEDASFDLIYSSEVIEHVADPNAFVAAVVRLLRPGGVFFVTTPDISHWRRPRDLADWDGFCPPSHCIYFTPTSLAGLVDRHGLAVVRRRLAWKPGIKIIARRRA